MEIEYVKGELVEKVYHSLTEIKEPPVQKTKGMETWFNRRNGGYMGRTKKIPINGGSHGR